MQAQATRPGGRWIQREYGGTSYNAGGDGPPTGAASPLSELRDIVRVPEGFWAWAASLPKFYDVRYS